ncbi:MAG: glycosyltransferase family 4 protein [Phycisphaerae bacterium]|jgi:glycosyltransferase involved in cell wall biosynthesis|nr:glycosyltransferase family 4 protein [Phycisphaerae bacterium]MDP7635960.1 glycosyltransferase family 4 protein [Phycisphaerae bacterium]
MITTSYPRRAGDMAGVFIESLARHLAEGHKIEVEVLAPGEAAVPGHQIQAGVEVRRLRYFWPARWQKLAYGDGIPRNLRRHGIAWLNIPPFFLAFAHGLCRRARQADVVHAHWGISGAVAVATRCIHRRPVVLSIRGSDVSTTMKPIRLATNWAIRRADAVISNCSESHEFCREIRGTSEGCYQILNGVQWHSDEELARFRQGLEEPGRLNIISVGRLIPERRHGRLVRAFAALRDEFPQSTLTIVGDGSEFAPLRDLAAELGVGGEVRMPGRVPVGEVCRYLCAADLYVSATRIEAAGNSVVEAAAQGLPIVTTRVGVPGTLVVDGQGGYTLEPDDEQGMVEAMRRMMRDPDLRSTAGQKMRRRVEELGLTWPHSARQTVGVYKSLARPDRSEGA